MSATRTVILVACAVTMGMFLVWQRSEIRRVGYQCGSLQKRAMQLEEENRRLLSDVCALKSPQLVMSKARSMELGLVEHGTPPEAASQTPPEKKEPKSGAAVASLHPARRGAPAPRSR